MKRIIFFISILSVIFGSCGEDFLERSPISNMNEADFYKNEADFNTALMAVYQTLHTIYAPSGPVSYFGELLSDNATVYAHNGTLGEYFEFRDHTLKASNSLVLGHWNNFYQSLFRVNTFIEKVQPANFPNKTIYEGEARFIRGLYYFLMVQIWGDVPLVLQPLNVEQSYAMPRTPASQVYEQVIADLDFAAKNLPTKLSVAEKGRICSEAAYGILAKVYLTMNPINKTKAQEALMNVYNKPGIELVSTYADLWDLSKKNGSEAIFEIQYKGGSGNPYSSYWRLFAPHENHGGLFLDGTPLRAAGAGDNQVTDDLWNTYEAGDIRRDLSIAPGWMTESGEIINTRFPIKWVDATAVRVGEVEMCDNNFIVLRYADILLLLSEVTGDPQYLNMVRNRVGLPLFETPGYPSGLYPTLESAIEHERRVELALEFHRFFDLKRTNRAAAVLSSSDKNIPAGQVKLVLPIPLNVITQNPDVILQNDIY